MLLRSRSMQRVDRPSLLHPSSVALFGFVADCSARSCSERSVVSPNLKSTLAHSLMSLPASGVRKSTST